MTSLLSQSTPWEVNTKKRSSFLVPSIPEASKHGATSTSDYISAYTPPAYFQKEGMSQLELNRITSLTAQLSPQKDSGEIYQKQSSEIHKTQQEQTQHILSKINDIVEIDDGSHLSYFIPTKPDVSIIQGIPSKPEGFQHMEQPPTQTPMPEFSGNVLQPTRDVLTNYQTAYDNTPNWFNKTTTTMPPQPYPKYEPSSTIIKTEPSPIRYDLQTQEVIEKLDRLLVLLENSKSESSQYVMEEFALYSCLGIFVIYTLDAFTRVGRYTR
jgi:hypothetical protein